MKRKSYYMEIGDAVRYRHDDNKTHTLHVIKAGPRRLGRRTKDGDDGDVVVWLSDMEACVLADRCTPVRIQPLTDEEYSNLGPRQLDELGDDE